VCWILSSLASRITPARGVGVISITLSAVDTHFLVSASLHFHLSLSLPDAPAVQAQPQSGTAYHSTHAPSPSFFGSAITPSLPIKKVSLLPITTSFCRSGLSRYLIICGLTFNLVVFFDRPSHHSALLGLLAYTTKTDGLSALQGIILLDKPHPDKHYCSVCFKSLTHPSPNQLHNNHHALLSKPRR
jgi:hypothetical protein